MAHGNKSLYTEDKVRISGPFINLETGTYIVKGKILRNTAQTRAFISVLNKREKIVLRLKWAKKVGKWESFEGNLRITKAGKYRVGLYANWGGGGGCYFDEISITKRRQVSAVKNGGFEDGLRYWNLQVEESGIISQVEKSEAIGIRKSDIAFGSKSCKIDATKKGFNVISQDICFNEPGTYDVSMRIFKSKGTGKNSGWAEMARAGTKILGHGHTRFGFRDYDQGVWKTYRQKVHIKERGEKHLIRLLVGAGEGYVLLDDVSIRRKDSSSSNVEFKISKDEIYVSKEIPMPFSVLMRCFAKSKEGVTLVVELPQNIELTALHGQPKAYSRKLVGVVKRDGSDYNQYVMTFRKARTFLGLMGVLKLKSDMVSKNNKLYYYARAKDKKQPVQQVNIKQITFRKGVQLKKLYIGLSHFNGDAFWKKWFPDNTFTAIKNLGVNMLVPWGLYSENFIKGVKENGIKLGRMHNFAHMKIPDNWKSVDKNGRTIGQPSLCVYQSSEFKKSIQKIVDIYKKGYTWYFPDEEFFYLKDIGYSERCKKTFMEFLNQKYPHIDSVEEGIKNKKVWLDFRTEQVFKWYEVLRNALDKEYKANPQYGKPFIVGVWRYCGITKDNLDGPARATFHDFKKLSRVVDYISPMLYQNWSFEQAPLTSIGDSAYGTYLAGKGNAGSFPTLTPGECHAVGNYIGNIKAVDIRDAALECFMTGSKGVVYWRGIGFDGLDCNYLTELSRMLALVEDIIYNGKPTKSISCSNKKVRCLAIKSNDKILVYLNNYTEKAESCILSGAEINSKKAGIVYPENIQIDLTKRLTIKPRNPLFIIIDRKKGDQK